MLTVNIINEDTKEIEQSFNKVPFLILATDCNSIICGSNFDFSDLIYGVSELICSMYDVYSDHIDKMKTSSFDDMLNRIINTAKLNRHKHSLDINIETEDGNNINFNILDLIDQMIDLELGNTTNTDE
jgi:hypothetical protein